MSLLDDVSIVVTPNGYKAGELYAVIPSNGDADMDVTRATAATRVDENGLVNYAEVIGGEEVVNGDFATDSDWTKGTGWTINTVTGEADASVGAYTNLIQSINFTDGATYIIEFTISKITSGNVRFYTSGSSPLNIGITRSSLGTFTESFTVSGIKDAINFSSATGFIGSIDNVSIKEIQRDNVPRIDYTGGGCPHILAEPQRTNLVTYSEDFSQSYWSKSNVDIISNNITSPDGTLNADKCYPLYSGNYRHIRTNSLNPATGLYTFSIFAKAGELEHLVLIDYDGGGVGIDYDLFNGVATDSATTSFDSFAMIDYGNGWYRCVATATNPYFYYILSDSGSLSVTANGTDGLYIWGAGAEVGSYPTSYIPTNGEAAGVTRNQDIFTRDGIGSLINSTEGVLFVEMAALSNDGTSRLISLSDGTNTKRINIYYDTSSNSIYGLLLNSSVQGITSFTLSDSTEFNKIAFKYKENDFALWVNGTEVDTDSSGTTFTSDTLNKLSFDRADGVAPFYGKVKQLQVYDTALTDVQLAALTS